MAAANPSRMVAAYGPQPCGDAPARFTGGLYVREHRSHGGEWRRVMRIIRPSVAAAAEAVALHAPPPYDAVQFDLRAAIALKRGQALAVEGFYGHHRIRRVW